MENDSDTWVRDPQNGLDVNRCCFAITNFVVLGKALTHVCYLEDIGMKMQKNSFVDKTVFVISSIDL